MSKITPIKQPTSQKISYKAYYDKGYIVCPEKNGIPVIGFSFANPVYDPKWEALDNSWGVGIITGSKSNITIVDIDEATKDEQEKLIKLLPPTPVRKFGSKGVSLFYRNNGEGNPTFVKDERLVVEILGKNKKSTLPPSLHRITGKEYIWLDKALLDIHASNELPMLPDNVQGLIESELNIIRPKPIARVYPQADYEYPSDDYNEALKALDCCNPNAPQQEWITILLSWKRKYDMAGFEAIDTWSARGKTYPGTNKLWQIWRKLEPHSVTIATMFHFAKLGGYRPPHREIVVHESLDPKEYSKLKLMEEVRKIEEADGIPAILSQAPPLIREFATWIYSTAVFPQPMLSLGAALSTIGFLMGRDFACAKSGIKANLYNICVAGSQEGKEHIKARCQQVMKEFDLLKNYQTSWTSGAAIELAMEETDGQVYYITDEMGIMMQSLVGKYTSANQQEAVSMLLRLYTEMYYKGKGYARSAERKPVEIDNPFISICGFTQREPFFEAMTSMQAFTGVLNRMCLFKAPDIRPLRNLDYTIEGHKSIPTSLKDAIGGMSESIEYLRKGKKQQSVIKYVPYSEGAQKLLAQINKDIDERFRRSQLDGENLHLIIGRSGEVLEKLALIASGGKIITEEILAWAKSVVDYSAGIMCESSKSIVDNEYERKKFKFVEFLEKKGGTVTLTDINNGFKQFSNRHEKTQIIDDLKDSGKIVTVPVGEKTAYKVIHASE